MSILALLPIGQDQMRNLKDHLCLEILPSVEIFLDVDDLDSGNGAEHLDKAQKVRTRKT